MLFMDYPLQVAELLKQRNHIQSSFTINSNVINSKEDASSSSSAPTPNGSPSMKDKSIKRKWFNLNRRDK